MDIRVSILCLCMVLQSVHCIAMESGWQEAEKKKSHKKKQQNFESKQGANAYSTDNAAPSAQRHEAPDINEKDKNDAYIHQKGYKGRTPLIIASLNGIEAEVTSLLERGAPVDERDDQGSTALMYSASGGKPTIVKELIVYKADVNLQDYEKRRTPLHWAIRMRKGGIKKDGKQNDKGAVLEILKILLVAGANPKIKDAKKCTPIDWADEFGWAQEAKLLRDAGSNAKSI